MEILTGKKLFRYRLLLVTLWCVGLVCAPGVVLISKNLIEATSLVTAVAAIFFAVNVLGVPGLDLSKMQAPAWFFLAGMFVGLLISSVVLPTPEGGAGLVGGLFWMTLIVTALVVALNWFGRD